MHCMVLQSCGMPSFNVAETRQASIWRFDRQRSPMLTVTGVFPVGRERNARVPGPRDVIPGGPARDLPRGAHLLEFHLEPTRF